MNINIKCTGIELTPEIRDYLNKKISALEKFVTEDDTGASVNADVGKTSNKHKCGEIFFTELICKIRKVDFTVMAYGDSLMASMDKAKDMALEILRKEKDKSLNY